MTCVRARCKSHLHGLAQLTTINIAFFHLRLGASMDKSMLKACMVKSAVLYIDHACSIAI